MTAIGSACPERATLEAWLARALPAADLDRIREHVVACKPCRSTLESIRFGARQALEVPPPAQVVSSHPTAEIAESNTVNTENEVPAPPQSPYFFLDPPIDSGEIGWLGPYRVLRLVGQGGMGMVFEAEDTALQRRVALKILRPEQSTDGLRKRFLQEARIVAQLPHDHIVTIYQVGQHNDVPFIAMEFLHGESLETRLDRDRWLPVAEAVSITRQVAEGLNEAHARGLIHRDIKPGNIWLEADKNDGSFKRVKLLDFGLARPIVTASNLTSIGQIVGTPGYMAPEQVRNLALDARTDLFSLGSTLYHMLTGAPPFDREESLYTLSAVVNEEPKPLEDVAPQVPASVKLLVEQLLHKDPANRPASAKQLLQRLRSIEVGDTVASLKPVTLPGAGAAPAGPSAKRGVSLGVWVGAGAILAALVIGAAVQWHKLISPSGENADPSPAGPATFSGPPIKVGLLHSQSGTFSASERAVADATLWAIEEINTQGGVLGRKIEPITADGRSNEEEFARQAEHLITREHVNTIFGCWSSSSRKRVAKVCETHNALLLYPLCYEGLEQAPNVFYIGGAPNQQLTPAAKWAFAFLGKRRFFLVGSDYVYSRAANEIIKDDLKALGATVAGEGYVPLSGTKFDAIVQQILHSNADIILNTIDGSSNLSFFHALRDAGITPARIPTIWFNVGEQELSAFEIEEMVGDYAAWSYFQSIDTPINHAFLKRFREWYGPNGSVHDPMEAAYCGVHLWKQAVEAAKSDQTEPLRNALKNQRMAAPEGEITMDPVTQHTWRMARIGRITKEYEFKIEWQSPQPLAPEPFPPSRSPAKWNAFLSGLYEGWGHHWEKPRR